MPKLYTDAASPDFIDISEWLRFFVSKRVTLFSFIIVSILLTTLYIFITPSIYQANALLQVEEKSKGFPGLEGLSEMLGETSSSQAEIEILRSRSILGNVVKDLHLDLIIRPHYFPLIGSPIARRYSGVSLADPLFGLDSYPWGGEQLKIGRFEITGPKDNEITKWRLIAGENNSYTLVDADESMALEGKVDALLSKKIGLSEINLLVTALYAKHGVEFTITRLPLIEAINMLSSILRVAEKGKDTGIINLSMEGADKQKIISILNGIANSYVRSNIEQLASDAQQMLEFVDQKLPDLKEKLEISESVFQQYQQEAGTVDLSFEAQSAVSQISEVSQEISELELKITELKQQYTDKHPMIKVVIAQIEQLNAKKQQLEEKLRVHPETQLLSIQKQRDVEVANELYLLMLHKQQELQLVKEGTVGKARIVDEAIIPFKPVKPKKALLLIAAASVGMVLGILFIMLQRAMNMGVMNSDEILNETGISVFASIPYSNIQNKLARNLLKKGEKQTQMSLLAFEEKEGVTAEAFRSLRTSMQFASRTAGNNIVVISGPAPNVGKSFVTSNIGAVIAESGKKVLVIDGDMRRGHLHKYMGVSKSPGLSEILGTDIEFEKAIVEINENMSFLPAGRNPPNPAELLMSERFQSMLTLFSQQFDVVIIDTPPILAVTDANIIARDAAQLFILLGYGKHRMKEIKSAITRFEQSGIKITGMIMNDVEMKSSGHAHDDYYYYAYK